jgi:hypothetical protein
VGVSLPARLISSISAPSVSVAPESSVIEQCAPFPPSACEARSIASMSALSRLALETSI